MTSKRHLRRKSREGKVKYLSKEEAQGAIGKNVRLGKVTGFIMAYRCKFCKFYHVGHVSRAR